MDGLFLIILLAGLALVIGSILGFVSFFEMRTLRQQVIALHEQLKKQAQTIARFNELNNLSGPHQKTKSSASDQAQYQQSEKRTEQRLTPIREGTKDKITDGLPRDTDIKSVSSSSRSSQSGSEPMPAKAKAISFDLERFLSGSGLLWLGGFLLAIGGIFLAKYSIEAGLFPPGLRIIFGAVFGLGLVIGADYLYRFPQKFNINTPVISAALASGGFITCYAMAFVAFDFYDFISPTLAFTLLAIISLSSAWLSIRLGPILAAIGVIGAYVVPALVSTGSNNVLLLLIYVSVVSFSSVWVHQVVKRDWIYYLTVVANFVWFAIALNIAISTRFTDFGNAMEQASSNPPHQYLAVLSAFSVVSIYLFSLFPVMGWNLLSSNRAALSFKALIMPRKEQIGVIVTLILMAYYLLVQPFDASYFVTLSVLSAVLLLAPSRHSAFDTWPFLALVMTVLVFLKMPDNYDYADNLFVFTGGYLFIQTAAFIGLAYAVFMHIWQPARPAYLLLLAIIPLLLFGIAYAFSNPLASTYLYPVFATELGVIALIFGFFATRVQQSYHKMTYLLVVNGALALIATMLLSASTLSLAFAAQITVMAMLSNRYNLPLPQWIYKAGVSVVVARLTLAPWFADYANEAIAGIHWTVIVYPFAFGLLFLAYKQITQSSLQLWFTGALVHLAALFITTETSYLLVGHYPDIFNVDFREAALLGMNYLIYATVLLYRRNKVSHPTFYKAYAILLLTGTFLMQLYASVLHNPYLSVQSIGELPMLNWLLPLWLLPSVLLFLIARTNLINSRYHNLLYIFSGAFIVLFINSIIRMAYEENIALTLYPIQQAELYTYSIVYLILSVGIIVTAQRRKSSVLLRIGFSILALVVLKAFGIDMNNLEGLYRALSFIGLGLSVVGIGWLFQRLNQRDSLSNRVVIV